MKAFFEWRGLTPLAIFISAFIAFCAIGAARRTARETRAIELIFRIHQHERFWQGVRDIREAHFSPDHDLTRYAYPQHAGDDIGRHLQYILNFLEHLSIGIHRGIYDEDVVKSALYSLALKTWDQVEPFISEARRQHDVPTLFIEYEALVQRWKKEPLETKR